MSDIKISQLPLATQFSGADVLIGNIDGVTKQAPGSLLVRAADRGGASVTSDRLKEWTESGAYEATSVTFDADQVVTTATVKWPDGSAGAFTTVTKNATWLAVDAYTISHTDSGLTVTQAAVTRDSDGNVTTKPALTVA